MSLLGAGSVYSRSVSRKARSHELGLDSRDTATKGVYAHRSIAGRPISPIIAAAIYEGTKMLSRPATAFAVPSSPPARVVVPSHIMPNLTKPEASRPEPAPANIGKVPQSTRQLLIDCGHERIRADLIEDYARQYQPADLVADLLTEGWPRWVSNPPDWFDDRWKARVPPMYIPQDDRPALLALPAPAAAADEDD